jgi:peptide chain release factor 3
LREELIDEVYPKFDRQDYLDGKLQPVFFGSALNNLESDYWIVLFKLLLHQDKDSETRLVEEKMSGFVFKIHANMDPNTETVCFYKIVSGTLKETNIITCVKEKLKIF